MRVFVSSTAYDLIDARAELAAMLNTMGISPVLSDDKLSAFKVDPTIDSIETCLVNLRACDEVILILDRRYGPSLKGAGYGDFSATHIEYKEARKSNIPVRFFIRDRTLAEYSIWKRNRRAANVEFQWVNREEDRGLFELLDEHQKLQKGANASNWFDSFTNSIDLKAAVAKYFEPRISEKRLVEALQNNTFPILNIDTSVDVTNDRIPPLLSIKSQLTNVGGAPAFQCRIGWKADIDKQNLTAVFMPGQSLQMQTLYRPGYPNHPHEAVLCATYQSTIGIEVLDEFEVSAQWMGDLIKSSGRLTSRVFRRVESVRLTVE